MKTISSPPEYDDVLSSSDTAVVACLPSKTVEGDQGQNNNYDNHHQGNNNEEKESLIICDSNLATGLQTVKSDVIKISPGHYLQKVFFNYSLAQKFRSQSLPSCVEKKKYSEKLLDKDCDKDLLKNHECSVFENNCENIVRDTAFCRVSEYSNLTDTYNSETWFKTWPERGNLDKRQTKLESQSQNNSNLSNDTLVHDSNVCSLQTVKDEQKPLKKSLANVESSGQLLRIGSNSPVHLNKVLENINLGYSPVTKQLHIIKSSTPSNTESQSNTEVQCTNSSKGSYKSGNVVSVCDSLQQDGKALSNTIQNGDTLSSVSNNNGSNLTRVATEASCCSFSSTVSSLSDISPSTNEDSALGSLLGLDHGDNWSLASIGECSILSEDSTAPASSATGSKTKKKSFSGFFSRNVFSWKSSNGDVNVSQQQQHRLGPAISENAGGNGWKLFGRSITSNNSPTVCHSGYSGYESGGGSVTPGSPCSVRSSGSISCNSSNTRVRSHENIVASSTALIQLDRPACLPAKSQHELEKHRQQYQDMVEAAKKKELKEAKQRKKQLQVQLRLEEQQAQATRTWSAEILPKWEILCNSRKTRDLWWLGIPPCVRGKVWRLAIGNELNLTQQLFDICCLRARDMLNTADVTGNANESEDADDNKEASVQLIQLDISRTFPNLCIFQQGGPYYDMLHCLLGAYVCYRPDVGYVQGMSFIAAVLILNMDVSDAFICFANLLNRPCHMAFFSLNQPLMQAYYATYNDLLNENLPHVYKHFVDSNLTPDLYLLDWIYTVFTKAMNLDLASRVWDVFLRDGEEFLFRAALGVLHLCQDTLLKMDFVHGSQYLTRLPDDLPADQLFKSIGSIKMTVNKQTFEQILAFHSLRHQQEAVNSIH
ncbi:TBC1 domain family member 14-like [Lycorma delicatula]|uniref:TBC1 domain family member 14-like n=1 Tax=Lycorma delicatula TaxID=130591 RepID=UPI003F517815